MSHKPYSLRNVADIKWYETRFSRKEPCWTVFEVVEARVLLWIQLHTINLTMAYILKKSLILKALSTELSQPPAPPHLGYLANEDHNESKQKYVNHRHDFRNVLNRLIGKWQGKIGGDSQQLPMDKHGDIHDAIKCLCRGLADYRPDYQDIDVLSILKDTDPIPRSMSEAEAASVQRAILRDLYGKLSRGAGAGPHTAYKWKITRAVNAALTELSLSRNSADVIPERQQTMMVSSERVGPCQSLKHMKLYIEAGSFSSRLNRIESVLEDLHWNGFYQAYWQIWREDLAAETTNHPQTSGPSQQIPVDKA